jgi:lysozyme
MTNVAGEDRSSFQSVTSWAGDAFGFAKATEGPSWADPTFERNWANLKGKPRGAYHFFHPADDPVEQAQHFISTVKARGGIAPGDMFVLDAEIVVGSDGLEDYGTARAPHRAHEGLRAYSPRAGLTSVGPAALEFMAEVEKLAGPGHQVLLYTNLSMAQNQLKACTAYPLFIAYYEPSPPDVRPWKSWVFWQTGKLGPGRGDQDYFNGDEAALEAFAGGTSNWTEELMQQIPTLQSGSKDTTAHYVHRLQLLTADYGSRYKLGPATAIKADGSFAAATKAAVEAVQAHAKLSKDGVAGQDTWTVLLTG